VITLHEARVRRLWSIRELATQAGVATRTIVQIEAGRIVPRYSTMRKIAAALGMEPTEIAEFAAAVEEAVEGKDAA
jgi:transcriptional regulator with XRE-family HTH domain